MSRVTLTCRTNHAKLTEELVLNINEMLRFTDDLPVSILNAVFDEDPTAPISTATHNLCLTRSLLASRLGAQGRKGMLHVVTDWILWALNPDEILIIPSTTFEQKPINALVPLILVPLDKVPPEDKVFSNVIDTVANQAHRNIMPWHPAVVGLAEFIRLPFANALKIHDAVVIEVLSWEYLHSKV
jgi:hypothetical protein